MNGTPCDTCNGCSEPVVVGVAANQPVTDVALYAGTFVKSHVVADAGTVLPQHSHHFPHLSFIASGAVRAWRDGELLGDFHAPAAVQIPAFAKHKFLTLAPGTTILCIHNVANVEGAEDHLVHEEHHLAMEG